MIKKELLKEIIVSNEEFILNGIKDIVKRENLIFPTTLNKHRGHPEDTAF